MVLCASAAEQESPKYIRKVHNPIPSQLLEAGDTIGERKIEKAQHELSRMKSSQSQGDKPCLLWSLVPCTVSTQHTHTVHSDVHCANAKLGINPISGVRGFFRDW